MAMQDSLFAGQDGEIDTPQPDRQPRRLRVMITVTAAPNPSSGSGETVCVAGLEVGVAVTSWVRLYPVNLRHLVSDGRFRKYDIVEVDARPATSDSRLESWKPDMSSLRVVSRQNSSWSRRAWIDPVVSTSMCALQAAVESDAKAPSLALLRPVTIRDIELAPHPGWTADEQRKIDAYVNQYDLLDATEKVPLEAPRFKGWYLYKCGEPTCRGHRQGVLDWEFVAYQRRLQNLSDERTVQKLRERFLGMVCDPRKDTCFYVGNQAKRRQTFSVIGMYYPPRS